MSVNDIYELIKNNAALIIVVVMSLIQIVPVKLNPWSAVVKWLQKILGITDLSTAIKKMQADQEQHRIELCRSRILAFGDDINRGLILSDEHFIQIMADTDTYEQYCTKHPDFPNSRTVATIELIRNEYKRKHRV